MAQTYDSFGLPIFTPDLPWSDAVGERMVDYLDLLRERTHDALGALTGTVGGYRTRPPAQTVPNATNVTIAMGTSVVFGGATAGANGIVVPTAGLYRVTAGANWSANGIAFYALLLGFDNPVPASTWPSGSAPSPGFSLSGVGHVAASAELALRVTQASGASRDISSAWMAVELIKAD